MNNNVARRQYSHLCKEENVRALNGKHLIKYERDKHGRPVGVLLAFKDSNGNVQLGWSRCNTKLEGFDKHIGINKAIKRATNIKNVDPVLLGKMPHQTQEELLDMRGRAERYFQVGFKPRAYLT